MHFDYLGWYVVGWLMGACSGVVFYKRYVQ